MHMATLESNISNYSNEHHTRIQKVRPSLSSVVLQFLETIWHIAHWNHLVSVMHMEKGSARATHMEKGSARATHMEKGSARATHMEKGSAHATHMEKGSARATHMEKGSARATHMEKGSARATHMEKGSARAMQEQSDSSSFSSIPISALSQNCEKRFLAFSCLSVCPYSVPTGRIFMKFDIENFSKICLENLLFIII